MPEAILVHLELRAAHRAQGLPLLGAVPAARTLQRRQTGARRQPKEVEHHEEACAGVAGPALSHPPRLAAESLAAQDSAQSQETLTGCLSWVPPLRSTTHSIAAGACLMRLCCLEQLDCPDWA